MNRHAVQLMKDLADAGIDTTIPLVPLRPASTYVRMGTVARTEETEKMEIAGLRCGVKSETRATVRVYVFRANGKGEGPYTLKTSEVI